MAEGGAVGNGLSTGPGTGDKACMVDLFELSPSSNFMTTPIAKRNRVEITAKHKREICIYKQYHPKITYDELAKHCQTKWNLKIGRSTLSDIFRQKEKWLNITSDQEDLLRARNGRHHKLEMELMKQLAALRKNHTKMVLTDQMIIENAKRIGEVLNVDPSFSYSKGWLMKFKRRHGLNTKDPKELSRRLSNVNKDPDQKNTPNLSLLDEDEVLINLNSDFDATTDQEDGSDQCSSDKVQPQSTQLWSFFDDLHNYSNTQSDVVPRSPLRDSIAIKQEDCTKDGEYGAGDTNEHQTMMDFDEGQGHWQHSATSSLSNDSDRTNDDGPSHVEFTTTFPVSLQTRHQRSRPIPEVTFIPCESRRQHKTTTPLYNTSPIVSVEEAKHCAIRCIRFFESHPELGDHLNGLWDVFHTLDNYHIKHIPKNKTIKHYFKKK